MGPNPNWLHSFKRAIWTQKETPEMYTQRKDRVRTWQEGDRLQAKQRGLRRNETWWYLHLGLPTSRKNKFPLLTPARLWYLLQPPKETHTPTSTYMASQVWPSSFLSCWAIFFSWFLSFLTLYCPINPSPPPPHPRRPNTHTPDTNLSFALTFRLYTWPSFSILQSRHQHISGLIYLPASRTLLLFPSNCQQPVLLPHLLGFLLGWHYRGCSGYS